MPDERESAVAAWLDDPSTRREIAIAQSRLALLQYDPNRPQSVPIFQAVMLALGVELLASLDIYGGGPQPMDEPDEDDDDDNESWRRR